MIHVVTGPSGCGKSSLIRLVLAATPGVRFSVSHTTRPRRPTEVEGRDYYFIDAAEFKRLIRRNAFVEWAVVHGALYGTSRKELRKGKDGDLILDIDVQGARQVRAKVKDAVFTFVLPPSFETLRERLLGRGLDGQQAIAERLETAKKEARECPRFDHVIINDDLNEAADELAAIIVCRRTRRAGRMKDIRRVLASFRKG
jgi:guanylate kinase